MFVLIYVIISLFTKASVQECPAEKSIVDPYVTWPSTPSGASADSDPLCYRDDYQLVTRSCSGTQWIPDLTTMESCYKTGKRIINDIFCPTGFNRVSENSQYCYQIGDSAAWNLPCFKSGGASIITDLNSDELESFFNSLDRNDIDMLWLPAQRPKIFNPVVWTIPGPNWGKNVESSSYLPLHLSIFENCLLLDVDKRMLQTGNCSNMYPTVCLYFNDVNYTAKCPVGYHAYRTMPDNGVCYGIEQTEEEKGLDLQEFMHKKCSKPMGNDNNTDMTKLIYIRLASSLKLPKNEWCWFSTNNKTSEKNATALFLEEYDINTTHGTVINSNGYIKIMNSQTKLMCMACKNDIEYQNAELNFELNEDMKMYLTIYFPSGLWLYSATDLGIRCFTDAKGFVEPVNIYKVPYINSSEITKQTNSSRNIEKTVYVVDAVTDRTAQYWCEGHTKNLTLIATDRIVVNAHGIREHVFALYIKTEISDDRYLQDIKNITYHITYILQADNVLLMDICEILEKSALLLFHVHITSKNSSYDSESSEHLKLYEELNCKALDGFSNSNIIFINMTSSMYCLPESSNYVFLLYWGLTEIGHTATSSEFCLQSNGLPVTRQCGGSYLFGSHWIDVDGYCDYNLTPSRTTEYLYNVANGNESNSVKHFLTDGLSYVLEDVDILIPADVYYLSMSLNQVAQIAQVNKSSLEMGNLDNIAWAMDRLMLLNDNCLYLSQTLNSTNVILDTVNVIIELISQKDPDTNSFDPYQLSVVPKFVTQISYPNLNNISGIAIIRSNDSVWFTDMSVKALYTNTTLDDLISINDIEIATWIPKNLLEIMQLERTSNITKNTSYELDDDLHIVINIYYNDIVFQELGNTEQIITSRIVEISIPGYETNLKSSVPLIFYDLNRTTESKKSCGYWNFRSNSTSGKRGFWTSDGCYFVSNKNCLTICECYHLTHFGQLINKGLLGNNELIEIGMSHRQALNLITVIGSIISLFGILGIWITALTFHSWRRKPGTKILLQLSSAIAFPLMIIIFFNVDNSIFVNIEGTIIVSPKKEVSCIILGACLHYSILSGFVWMLITAILQFIRYVQVLGVTLPSRFILKISIAGWGLPLIPVICVILSDKNNYLPSPSDSYSYTGICYPSGIYFYVGVLMPVCLILLVNIVLFLMVMFSISRGPDGKIRKSELDLVRAQLKLSVFLFFLLGFSWIFGICSFSQSLIWSYLFCFTATIQGFILFLYFVICDPGTRSLWVTLMKPQFSFSLSRDHSTSTVSM